VVVGPVAPPAPAEPVSPATTDAPAELGEPVSPATSELPEDKPVSMPEAAGAVLYEVMYSTAVEVWWMVVVITVAEDPTPWVYVRVVSPDGTATAVVTGMRAALVAAETREEEIDSAAVTGHTVVVRAMVAVTTTPPVDDRAGQLVTVEAQA